jgi:hypothetical protein
LNDCEIPMVSRALVYGRDYTIWSDDVDRNLLTRAREDGKIKCHCGKALTFVSATMKIPHFRHRKGNCSIIGAERDTTTHIEGLEYLGQVLRKSLGGVATVAKEETFKVRDGLRRTDIFAKFNDGRTICYELQCSPISESELSAREAAYKSLRHKLVWIFGPESSGLKVTPHDSVYGELTKGKTFSLKEVPLSVLERQDYLALYFPDLADRLWIAYCADQRFDRTREFVLERGDKQILLSIPEARLTMFKLKFEDGIPYADSFPAKDPRFTAILKRRSAKREKLQTTYAREFDRLRIRRVSPTPRIARRRPNSRRFRRVKGIANSKHCILCGSRIRYQHYHKCDKCGAILDDSCTMMIESDLEENGHNMTGWVRHCDWEIQRTGSRV